MTLPALHDGDFRANVLTLQNALMLMETTEECPVEHHFAPGMYMRTIFMRAGLTVVGKIHKHSHVNILSQGHCTVATEFGNEELVAPCRFVSEPGTKRAVYVHSDCIWTTVHLTDETDLEKIEAEIISPDYEHLLEDMS